MSGASKFFKDAGKKVSKGAKSVGKGGQKMLSKPFDMVGGMVSDITSSPMLLIMAGGVALILVMRK